MSNLKALAFAGLIAISSAACAQVGGGGGMGAWTLYVQSDYVTTPEVDNYNQFTNTTGSAQPWSFSLYAPGDNYCTGDSPTYEPDWDIRVGYIYDSPPTEAYGGPISVPNGGTISVTVVWTDELFAQTWLWSDGETQANRQSDRYSINCETLNESWN